MGYKGTIISDWDRIKSLPRKKYEPLVRGALQAFMDLPKRYPVLKRQADHFAKTGEVKPIEAFATGDDFPTSVVEVLDKFRQTTYYDTGFEQVFDMKDMRSIPRSSFEILDVTSGLTFGKTAIGERAQLYKMSGAKTTVSVDLYSGGLQWHKTLFDDEEYWTLEDNAVYFRNKAFSSKAQDFYDLIDATSNTYDLALQSGKDSLSSGTEGYTVQRDIETINTACLNILKRCKGLGFGVGPQTEMIILAPLDLRERLTDALSTTFQAKQGSPTRLGYNIRPIYTLMLSEADKYYVILPKNKIKGATRMDLTVLTDMDITSYSELAVGWMRYGGAIGEEKQIVRCSTS